MSKPHHPSAIAQLRALIPHRVLLTSEAQRLAELQAGRFLTLSGVTEPPVSELIVAELPRVKIGHNATIPVSGYSKWVDGHWLLVVNSSETFARQRFTLFHELKHALDHPIVSLAYRYQSKGFVEQICDLFAANVLMPRAWVKSAYCNDGLQDVALLARRFGVSQSAMRVRIDMLGLTLPIERCAPYQRELATPVVSLFEIAGGVA